MINEHSVLCIIPARGGSKRLPGKNIKPIGGKPMIAYAIAAGKGSMYVDRTIVSTDDDTIARIAKEHGAEVPFLRPPELATDMAKAVDVVFHALDALKEKDGYVPDVIVLIQPTAPLVQSADVDGAIRQLTDDNTRTCVTMAPISERPEWMYRVENGRAAAFLPAEPVEARSQDLPLLYRINGAVYVVQTEEMRTHKRFTDPESLSAYIMPRERSVDVDELVDFQIAEVLLAHNKTVA